MDWLTIILVLAMAMVSYRGYRNGFVRELVSLGAVVLAIPVAGLFYDDMYPKIDPIIGNDLAANLVSFLAILGGVIIGGQVAAHLLKQAVAALNLGGLDHVAGGAFGLVKALLLAQAVLIVSVAYPKPNLQDEIDRSPVASGLLEGAPIVLGVLPGVFDQRLDLYLDGFEVVPRTPGAEDQGGESAE